MDRSRKLKQLFPGTNLETRLVLLGNAHRLHIRGKPLMLSEYRINEEESVFAVYDEGTNTIYVRLVGGEGLM